MVVVTRLPNKRVAGKHIGTWLLEQQKEKDWSVKVTNDQGGGT